MSGRSSRLASRLMAAEAIVVAVGAATLVVTAALVAPGLFHRHLMSTGEDSPQVNKHAEQAFATSFAIALSLAVLTALIAAGLVSWFLVRRVAHPVEELADAAELVAAGTYSVAVPDAGFSSELGRLSVSFSNLAERLADTEATRSRLLSDLAHELRTPLATLAAYIDGLEDNLVPADPISYATMRDQVARLRRLAGDLREVAAAAEHALNLVMARLDPVEAAEGAVAAVQPAYHAKGVNLRVAAKGSVPAVLADGERLQQVLGNLLDNALRHTAAGGSVELAVSSDADTVALEICDDGEGIPVSELGRVFERFHRVDPARSTGDGSGSGLGLTIARAILVEHGGTLTAASSGPGTGATLTVRLPVHPQAEHQPGSSR